MACTAHAARPFPSLALTATALASFYSARVFCAKVAARRQGTFCTSRHYLTHAQKRAPLFGARPTKEPRHDISCPQSIRNTDGRRKRPGTVLLSEPCLCTELRLTGKKPGERERHAHDPFHARRAGRDGSHQSPGRRG